MANNTFIPCLTCAKAFKTMNALKQHQDDTYHFKTIPAQTSLSKEEMWTLYLIAFYEEKAMVLRDDRRKSRKIVQLKLLKIREAFEEDSEDEEDFYSFKVQPAGSTATQTKVLIPDEYDFNLVIELEDITFRDSAPLFFDVEHGNGKQHLQELCDFIKTRPIKPPKGYTTVRYSNQSMNQKEELTYKGFLVPRKVQEHLYANIKDALEDDHYISVSCVPNGPAITFQMRPPKPHQITGKLKNCITHEISVDFAVAIKIDKDQIPIDKYGWPRDKTKECMLQDTIERILDAGVYLVPKHDLFWYISFSNAAKVLLRSIDSGETCRRKCHKILKADFLTWHSEQRLPGISTFIFKNHLFWFNEELNVADRESYWHQSNLGKCYVDLLQDLSRRLKNHLIQNYFNANENILANKDEGVLNRLSLRIDKRVSEMENIKLD